MKFQGLKFENDDNGNKVSIINFNNGLSGKVIVTEKGNRDRDSDKEWKVECWDSETEELIPTFFEYKGVDNVTTDKNEVIELLTIIQKEEEI